MRDVVKTIYQILILEPSHSPHYHKQPQHTQKEIRLHQEPEEEKLEKEERRKESDKSHEKLLGVQSRQKVGTFKHKKQLQVGTNKERTSPYKIPIKVGISPFLGGTNAHQ